MKEQLIHFENEAGFRALFDHATVGIIVVDKEGCILLANPITQRLFGYSQQELEGQRVEVLIPEKFKADHTNYRRAYHSNPKPREMGAGQDLYAQRKDGTVFPVEISLSSYEIIDDRVMVAFITDITSRKSYTQELEKKVIERTKQLEQLLKNEKSISEVKSKFISIASHEFRTPLSTILSSTSLIEKYIERGDKASQRKHTSRIKSSVDNLNDILTDFLSLEKLEEGMVVNNPTAINLHDFLKEVMEELEGELKENQTVVLNTEITAKDILIDKGLLRTIIINLLSNAIKYSGKNTVINLSLKQKSELWFTVKDQGIGIPEEDQKRIFSRFFRASNVENIKGTGLGLNIIKRYAEIMNGNLSFDSEQNTGSTFIVHVPYIVKLHDQT